VKMLEENYHLMLPEGVFVGKAKENNKDKK
jgi:hypothetical protein